MSGLLSDQRLVQRAAGGEEHAFAAIFERYHQRLYRYCLAIVGDSQDAQDALQNTMIKVLRALPGEQRDINLKPWLYRIAHNESVDLLRRRRDTRQLDAELAATGPAPADELSSRERLRQLLSDLDELPERQRGALVMRELAGLDFDGIAAALETSPAVARQTLYEARLGLHQMDEGRGMDCAQVTQALSDGDGRVTRRRDIRAHLRDCPSCRRFGDEIEGRERDFAALAPLPAVVAGGLLQSLLAGAAGGGGAAAGGGGATAGAAVAGGAAKTLGSSAALKGAAAILAVAAIGTGAAERSGLIDLGLPGEGGSKAAPAQRPAEAEPAPVPAGGQAAGAPSRSSPTPASRLARGKIARKKQGARSGAAGVAGATGGREASAEAAPPGSSQAKAVAHPHGKGHEKQHPAAAAHGQQTAAAHKNTGRGAGGGREHPVHPSKPPHPAHPPKPSAGKEKAPPKSSAPAPETGSDGGGVAGGASGEEVPTQPEPGKKP
jgi:RNA polymerase sigma factor (sigma-70 family)